MSSLLDDIRNVTLKYQTLHEQFYLENGMTHFQRVSPKDYVVVVDEAEVGSISVRQDGVYDVVLTQGQTHVFPMTAPAKVHILWLLPQYLLLTIGEILFSVSSMDFAYSEAPSAMKSILQAANLFTITIGLWLFAGLTAISTATGAFQHRASHQALLYAGLMAVDTLLFVMLLRWYNKQPKNTLQVTDDHTASENIKKEGPQDLLETKSFI